MNVKQILDRSTRYDGLQTGDSDFTRRRQLHLEILQDAFDEFNNERPWPWRMRVTNPITIASGTSTYDLPADFSEFGAIGSLFDSTNRVLLSEVSPIEIQQLQRMPPITIHQKYAVFNVSSPATGFKHQLQIGANGATQTFVGNWLTISPTLTDTDTATSGLGYIPEQYHYSILLERLKAEVDRMNGDQVRYGQRMQTYRMNLEQAVRVHGTGRRSSVQKLPSAVPYGMW